MSFSQEFIKSAAENAAIAAEKLAQKVKDERVNHDAQFGKVPSIQKSFKEVVSKDLEEVATVEFIDKSIFVGRKIKGTIQTQEAVKQAYEKLEIEEGLSTLAPTPEYDNSMQQRHSPMPILDLYAAFKQKRKSLMALHPRF